MLQHKKITSDGDRERFAQIFASASRGHKSVSNIYLQNAVVFVFYYSQHPSQWVAGYVINVTAPFRYFEVLDDNQKYQLLAQHSIREDDLCEVTCIWIDNSQVSKKDRLYVYFRSMIDAIEAGKGYIFGGSTEPKVVALQQQIMPHFFHNDQAMVCGELTDYWIYYVGRWGSVYTMLRFLGLQFFGQKRTASTPTRRPALPHATV